MVSGMSEEAGRNDKSGGGIDKEFINIWETSKKSIIYHERNLKIQHS